MPVADPTSEDLSVARPGAGRRGAPARAAAAARVGLLALGVVAGAAGAAVVAVGAAALAAVAPAALAADDLHGHVLLMAKDGKGPAHGSEPQQAVVYFEPAAGGRAPRPPEAPLKLVTRRKEFMPRVLVVPVGSRVLFPNEDPILHNVFSVSPGNSFDLGIYRNGPPKEKRFDTPGLVRVFCNVHQTMVAYILVLDTPYYTTPADDGSFRLTGLPRGAGKLTVWHEQADPWSTAVTLPLADPAAPLDARLVVVRPKLPPHLNKTGGAYNRSDDYR